MRVQQISNIPGFPSDTATCWQKTLDLALLFLKKTKGKISPFSQRSIAIKSMVTFTHRFFGRHLDSVPDTL